MKNGYYLSTYVCVSKLGYLYKKSPRHDFNISLWRLAGTKVELVRYWELERFTGQKQHTAAFFSTEHFNQVIQVLLEEEGLTLNDIQEIWGTPELGEKKNYFFADCHSDFAYHSICHAFSALLLDTAKFKEENILCLSVDSCPDNKVDVDAMDKYFYMGIYSQKGDIRTFPVISPAEIWEAASDYYELREGTLMALAYASEAELCMPIKLECLAKNYTTRRDTYLNVQKFLQEIDEIDGADDRIRNWDSRFTQKDNIISAAMKILQKLSINIMENTIDTISKELGIDLRDTYLAISGGYGLNCPTNSYLMNKYSFKGFIAPPCINDSGISLGCALYTFYNRIGSFEFKFSNAYQGDADNDLQKSLLEFAPYIEKVSKCSPAEIAEDIIGDVIVWFEGKGEIGPRALGHRSLLANPCDICAKDRLNKIKQRQWWRPVAPIILEDELNNWFQMSYRSPYMLHNFVVFPDMASKIPAILHLDNTARIQTIRKEDDSFLYKVIEEFSKKEGVPIICNTSLNDKGEPIIDTIKGALNFAIKKNIHIVYINHIRIQLRDEKEWGGIEHTRKIDFFGYIDCRIQEKYKKEMNPYECNENIIDYYLRTGERENLTDKKDVRRLILLDKATNQKYISKRKSEY